MCASIECFISWVDTSESVLLVPKVFLHSGSQCDHHWVDTSAGGSYLGPLVYLHTSSQC